MAIIKGSIFGQIQKRVGTEVGYVVGKRNLLRSWNPNPVNPRTPAQQKNRNWLYILLEQYKNIKSSNFIKYQYKNKGETQQTTFCRINKNAVECSELQNTHKIVFEKLLLSQGNVRQLDSLKLISVGNVYMVNWLSYGIVNESDRNDIVNIIVLKESDGLPLLVMLEEAYRYYSGITLNLPITENVYVYVYAKKKDGTVSNSQCLPIILPS